MRLRNNIFAAAFDYLKREKGIKTQKKLAELMGVSEDTITRILKDRTEVTEDIITKLQTASGCIFNLQWLRGEDNNHMLAEEMTSNEDCANQDRMIYETIDALKKQIAILEKRIEDKDAMIKMKDKFIRMLEYRLEEHDNSFSAQPVNIMSGDLIDTNK